MEYFVYCRDKPDSEHLRMEVAEAHWSFMDHYADVMIGRGPTLAGDDDERMTGSMHIVDLPDAAAVEKFAFEELFYKAGLFADVEIHRWSNALRRTMWDFRGPGGPRFLVIGHSSDGASTPEDEVHDRQLDFLRSDAYRDGLILCGPLLSDDCADWLGSVVLAELPGGGAVETMMEESPYGREHLFEDLEFHSWRFGGRPEA